MRRAFFVFWILVTVVTVLELARFPGDWQWWISLAACILGLGFYAPIRTAARVRKTAIIHRPLAVVYEFLSRPANLRLWNRGAGMAQPADVPLSVGQEWTYSPRSPWIRTPALRHVFSKVDPPHMLEITVQGPGVHAVYSYTLRETEDETELMLDATIFGMPILAAWLTSAYGRLFPSRDLAQLKRVLEVT
jgi:uncharacterized protein YndB with AHSA1/START domain